MTNIENENVLRQKVIDALFEYEVFMDNKFVETANNVGEDTASTTLKLDLMLGDHRHFEDDIESIMTTYRNGRRKWYKNNKGKYDDFENEIG